MACSRDCDNTNVCLNSPVDDDPSAHNLQVHHHLAIVSYDAHDSLPSTADSLPPRHIKQLSQLLGRLCKYRSDRLQVGPHSLISHCWGFPTVFTLYNPNGVSALDHPELMAVRAAIINWSRGLPADLRFDGETDGKDSRREALRLFYVPVLVSIPSSYTDCLP
jgi:hypothetical protein